MSTQAWSPNRSTSSGDASPSTGKSSTAGPDWCPGLPKGRRRRVTMFPEVTPNDVDLAAMVERRLGEVNFGDPFFPAARGGWQRRSNYGRYIWDRAAAEVGWPRRDDGRWL